MRKTIVLAICVLVFLGIGSIPATAELDGWQYQREITIRENSGQTLTDYQLLLDLSGSDFPAGAKSDGADLQFTDSSGNELSYWIEEFNPSTETGRVWVKVPSIPARGETKITMYYGNPSARSQSNGEATFEFFDDFEDGTLGKWSGDTDDFGALGIAAKTGSYGISHTAPDATSSLITVSGETRKDGVFEVWLQDRSEASTPYAAPYTGHTLRSDVYEAHPWPPNNALITRAQADDDKLMVQDRVDGVQTYHWSDTVTIDEDTWYFFRARVKGTSVTLELHDANMNFLKSYSTTISSGIDVSGYFGVFAYRKAYYDDYRVRKYTSSEPTISFSAEQFVSERAPTSNLTSTQTPLSTAERIPVVTPTTAPTPASSPSISLLYLIGAAVLAVLLIAGIGLLRSRGKGGRTESTKKPQSPVEPKPPVTPPKPKAEAKPPESTVPESPVEPPTLKPEPVRETEPLKPESAITITSAVGYKGPTIFHKIKVSNPTSEPVSDIKIRLFVPDTFLFKDPEKSIALLKPNESKSATFEIRPTKECGDCEVSGRVTYYDYASRKTKDADIPAKLLSIVCPVLKPWEIEEPEWRSVLSRLVKAEETTREIEMPAKILFDTVTDILKDLNIVHAAS